MSDDPRAEPPEPTRPPEPTTKAIPQTEVLSGLMNKLAIAVERVESKQDAGFVAVKADFNLLAGQFDSLENDVRGLQSWRVRTDDWRAQSDIRMSSSSMRAQQPSQMDLDLKAQLGLAIASAAEEKAKREALEAKAVTKDELQTTTAAQTKALIDELKKDPTVQKAVSAIAGAVATAGTLIAAYLASRGH